MRRKLLSAARSFAAGVDVSPREVRLVIASRKRRGDCPVRVEWIGAAPLSKGAISGAQLVDRAAVTAALSSLCERWPRRHVLRGMPCFMAAPGGAATMSSAALATRPAPNPIDVLSPFVNEFEPAAFDETSAPCRLEPGAHGVTDARRYLQARVEAAAAAGIALAAVDGEPLAALRALTYAAGHAWRAAERYVALWAGYGGVYGWRIADRVVEAAIRFPGGEHSDLESALRLLAGAEGLDRALVGGDVPLLERIGLSLADIGERLGCAAEPFDCAPFCCRAAVLAQLRGWKQAASYAVAFGLALRGVTQ